MTGGVFLGISFGISYKRKRNVKFIELVKTIKTVWKEREV